MSDTPNPYKICGGCAASPAEDCDHGAANCNDVHSAWQEGFNAGLEAAAAVCAAETEDVQREGAEFNKPQVSINYAVGSLCLAAQKIRAMKGGDEG